MLQRWLTSAFFCMCLLGLGWAAYSPLTRGHSGTSIAAAVGVLWLLGTATHLNQALAITRPLLVAEPEMTSDSPLPRHIAALAAQLKQFPLDTDQPILAVGTDADWSTTRGTTTIYDVATTSDCHERRTVDDDRERLARQPGCARGR